MKKIVFIINSAKQARCIKRVEEFIEKGYQVEAYGFDRNGDNRVLSTNIRIIGTIQDGSDYFARILYMRKCIKNTIKNINKKEETLFYLFNFDVAISFISLNIKHKYKSYFYEVSDLAELTIHNKIIKNLIIKLNKYLMNYAELNIFTSEGFKDYYSMISPSKIFVIPNKVSTNCPPAIEEEKTIDTNSINIGFVGVIRFETIYNFIRVAAKKKNVLIHLFGIYSNGDIVSDKIKKLVDDNKNIIYHGPFKNPNDLPQIYNQIDLVLSAYPPTPGVIYAEPNKLYEAMYFRCPIIVSKNTFLGKKVERLNVGYVIDATSEESIDKFLSSIDIEDCNNKINSCRLIPQKDCLNINEDFFKRLETLC